MAALKLKPYLAILILLALGLSCSKPQQSGIIEKEAGFKTHYEVFGSGNPLLLINGGPGYSSEGFRTVAQQLADSLNRQVIIYDQRGTGQSKLDSLSPETISIDLMVQDIEDLRKELSIEEWVVMGQSFGGTLGAAYTAKHPNRVTKLILSSSGGMDLSTMNSEGTMARLTQTQIDSMMYWSRQISGGDTSFSTRYKWATYLAPAFVYDKQFAPAIATRLTQGNRELNGLVISDMMESNFDLKEPLSRFERPVLIIQGKYDIIKESTGQQTHGVFPNSKLVILDSSGHYGWLDKPKEYFHQIEEFLTKN